MANVLYCSRRFQEFDTEKKECFVHYVECLQNPCLTYRWLHTNVEVRNFFQLTCHGTEYSLLKNPYRQIAASPVLKWILSKNVQNMGKRLYLISPKVDPINFLFHFIFPNVCVCYILSQCNLKHSSYCQLGMQGLIQSPLKHIEKFPMTSVGFGTGCQFRAQLVFQMRKR